MEDGPFVEVNLETLKDVFMTYSRSRTRDDSFVAIAMLAARLQIELPDSKIGFDLPAFGKYLDSTVFLMHAERTGPGHRWDVTREKSASEVFYAAERRTARIGFMLRIEGDGVLQYCVKRSAGSPWRQVDEAGAETLVAEAKRLWGTLA